MKFFITLLLFAFICSCQSRENKIIYHETVAFEFINPIDSFFKIALDTFKGYYKEIKLYNRFNEDIQLQFCDNSEAKGTTSDSINGPFDKLYLKQSYSQYKGQWMWESHGIGGNCRGNLFSRVIKKDSFLIVSNFLGYTKFYNGNDSDFFEIQIKKLKSNQFVTLNDTFVFSNSYGKIYELRNRTK